MAEFIDTNRSAGTKLNESQQRSVLVRWREIDRLMTEIESVLSAGSSTSVFPKYKSDLSPVQARIIRDYIANIRRELIQSANALGVPLPKPDFGGRHSIRVDLIFAAIAAEECTPEQLKGYGEVSAEAAPQLRGMVEQLKTSFANLMAYLAEGADFGARLQRLDATGNEIELLRRIGEIVDRRGMVEFRPAIQAIIDRLETTTFEIAVFGRVSSGKSSLLDHVLGTEVLPVGVTPVTAVPTRVVFGAEPAIVVSFAIGREERLGIDRLQEFVTEDKNRANEKQVTRIVVEIPSPRLQEGITFVDTPGLGSLATEGAAETMAYLPKCDMGVLLVDSSSTLTEEDVGTIRMLLEAGIPASVLLSKADLIDTADRERAAQYTKRKVQERLGVDLPVRPVSVAPGKQSMLETWFAEEIAPLYKNHRELARQSVRRKIGVLRESVESALRTMLRNDADKRPASEAVERAGRRLREATGAFEIAERRCFGALERLRDAPGRTIAGIASEAATMLQRGALQEAGGEWVRSAAQRIAAEAARDIPTILAELATGSAAGLIDCATDLNLSEAPGPGEFAGGLQEMPLLDIGAVEIALHAGPLRRKAPAWTARHFERQLGNEIGPALELAFSNYSSVLRQWFRSALQQIREQFDRYGEIYRAAIARLEVTGADSTADGKETESRSTGAG